MSEETIMPKTYEEITQVYDKIVELYGMEVFRESRRVIGCVLDLAPKRRREAEYLAIAYELHIPEGVIDNQINNNKKAREAVERLKDRNVPQESALVLVETLGKIFGRNFTLQSENKGSVFIPYVTKKEDSIAEAIQYLDHIRWFINHQDRYQWKNGKTELDSLRQMIYLPQENYKKIREIYRKIVHNFQNDPYKAAIILGNVENIEDIENETTDDHMSDKEITANNFGDYFTLIYNEPVSMSFACYYGGAIVDNSIYSWKIKKKNFCQIVEDYRELVPQVPLPDKKIMRTKRKRILSFCLCSTIVWILMFFLLYQLWDKYRLEQKFFVFAAIILLLILMASCICSVYRVWQLKKAEKISKMVSKQIAILKQEIPEKIEEIDKVIVDFYNEKKGAADFEKSDYSLLLSQIEKDKHKV